jgi:DNA polymerase-3 subunit delta'
MLNTYCVAIPLVKTMVKIKRNLKFQKLSHLIYILLTLLFRLKVSKQSLKALILLQNGAFNLQNPYGGLFDWYAVLGVQNKQAEIRVDDATRNFKIIIVKIIPVIKS